MLTSPKSSIDFQEENVWKLLMNVLTNPSMIALRMLSVKMSKKVIFVVVNLDSSMYPTTQLIMLEEFVSNQMNVLNFNQTSQSTHVMWLVLVAAKMKNVVTRNTKESSFVTVPKDISVIKMVHVVSFQLVNPSTHVIRTLFV